jgi:hypothetical protein
MSELQHQRIEELCQELRLAALPGLYGPIAQAAAKKKVSPMPISWREALRAERESRRARSREMLTRTAGFPAIKTLEAYDFGFATGAPRAQLLADEPELCRARRERRAAWAARHRQDASGDRARLSGGATRLEGALHQCRGPDAGHGDRTAAEPAERACTG